EKREAGRGKREEGGRGSRGEGTATPASRLEMVSPHPSSLEPPLPSSRFPLPSPEPPLPASPFPLPSLDRTPQLFIRGKPTRPDQGYSRQIRSPSGELVGESPEGNRKDIRNAVEAAHKAAVGWARATGHNRGQILYYIAENLSARAEEFAHRIDAMTG